MQLPIVIIICLYCWCTHIIYSRKVLELSPTHSNVILEVIQVPIASKAWMRGTWVPPCWHWGWNCTWCTLQTICQLKYTRVHVQVHLSLQAQIGVLEHELGCTWTWVSEVLPLFMSISSRVTVSTQPSFPRYCNTKCEKLLYAKPVSFWFWMTFLNLYFVYIIVFIIVTVPPICF